MTTSAAERAEHAVTAVIIANSVIMLLTLIDHSHAELLENVDLACLWVFAAELAVRLWKAKLGFFHSPWSCLDAAIIVVALLPIAGGGLSVARLGRLARSGHLLKHVAHLRLWRLFRGRVIGPHAREVGLATTVAVLLTAASLVAPAAHADVASHRRMSLVRRRQLRGSTRTSRCAVGLGRTQPWTSTAVRLAPTTARLSRRSGSARSPIRASAARRDHHTIN